MLAIYECIIALACMERVGQITTRSSTYSHVRDLCDTCVHAKRSHVRVCIDDRRIYNKSYADGNY